MMEQLRALLTEAAPHECWVELGRWHRACDREIMPTCGEHKEERAREALNETWAEKNTCSRLFRSLCDS
jgi:hypothetical protein